MRVIAGSAKGIPLRVPRRVTRPTTDRLREALFSILGGRVPGAAVLDLFAGSGALGIEALSRGAGRCTFVEADRAACGMMRRNLEKARLAGGRVVCMDVFAALGRLEGSFDLILADPPYVSAAGVDLAGRLVAEARLPGLLGAGGWLIVETEAGREPPGGLGWEVLDRRVYGGSAVVFYVRQAGSLSDRGAPEAGR